MASPDSTMEPAKTATPYSGPANRRSSGRSQAHRTIAGRGTATWSPAIVASAAIMAAVATTGRQRISLTQARDIGPIRPSTQQKSSGGRERRPCGSSPQIEGWMERSTGLSLERSSSGRNAAAQGGDRLSYQATLIMQQRTAGKIG